MDANVNDEAVLDQRLPFVRAVEQLAHGKGRCAMGADLAEIIDVFRGERILEEEEPELLHIFGELNRKTRRNAFVHVVQKLNLRSEFLAGRFEELQRAADICFGIEDRILRRLGCGARMWASWSAVSGHARDAH